jgi:putative methylase
MLLKKHQLINLIENLETFQTPKLDLEQYTTDPVATADLFYHITFEQRDLEGNLMVDLGCGTGNLSIAGAILGSSHVIGVDADSDALKICKKNIQSLDLEKRITLLEYDILSDDFLNYLKKKIKKLKVDYEKIIVVSNPPFGVHNRGADTKFLEKALQFADIIYSIHLASPKSRMFLKEKIPQLGGAITHQAELALLLKHTYAHHQMQRKLIQTDVYRIVKPI